MSPMHPSWYENLPHETPAQHLTVHRDNSVSLDGEVIGRVEKLGQGHWRAHTPSGDDPKWATFTARWQAVDYLIERTENG